MLRQFIFTLIFYNTAFNRLIFAQEDEQIYGDTQSHLSEPKYHRFNYDRPALHNILRNHRQKKYKDTTDNWPDRRTNNRESRDYQAFKSALKNWTGKWFPEQDVQPTVVPEIHVMNNHSVPMGKIPNCDDGKTNLKVDWDGSPINYTCFGQKITPNLSIQPKFYCEHISQYYQARHLCMNETIEYNLDIPMFGTHRPVWPVYGEYKFLPRQRWIHSLEHGAVVMLYHPCANPIEVLKLKNLVKKCLRRHIITAYSLLDEQQPLALVTWGCRLTMSYTNPMMVKRFITSKALHGPEFIPNDGQYDDGLLKKADIVSDFADSQLCPHLD